MKKSGKGRGQRLRGESPTGLLRPPADTLEGQDHKKPEDVLNPEEGDCGFESHIPVEEYPKVCLIKDGKSRVWTVFGVIGPRGLLPPEKTKLLLFLKLCWLTRWDKFFLCALSFVCCLCLAPLCI